MKRVKGCRKDTTCVVAGIDVGAATAKAVIVSNGKIIGRAIEPTGHSITLVSNRVINSALDECKLTLHDLQYIISTGYGRRSVSFAHKPVTEIMCHGKGARYVLPDSRTIIDIGGQDSKIISLDDNGMVSNFVMNDKCAAGTGRFLEVMAKVLDLDIEEIGPISLTSKQPAKISNTCTIFAESEMVSLRAEGIPREDLVAGIVKAISSRVVIMGKSLGFQPQVVFTGGVAKNSGVKKALEGEIGLEIITPQEPQMIGALGAALLALEEINYRE